jgi:hypothetical protein
MINHIIKCCRGIVASLLPQSLALDEQFPALTGHSKINPDRQLLAGQSRSTNLTDNNRTG